MKNLIMLFDLDGTVIDSTEAILESFHYAFDKHNLPSKKNEEITSLIGYPLTDMFTRLGVTNKIENKEIVLSYKKNYRKVHREKTFLIPQAKEAIELASKHGRLGVVTTKTGTYSQELLEHLKIMDYFETLIGFEHVKKLKPHPEPILTALKNMNHKNEEVWMIGDTKMDLIAASSAKINGFGVTTGYGTEESLRKHTLNIEENLLRVVEKIIKNQS
ncbi:MAG: HAD family hydrolase [Campylobacterales bacterium]|nr:HAD family hydrolase [Campylobacterales bacterium]